MDTVIECDTEVLHRECLADVAHEVAVEREQQAITVDDAVMLPHRLSGGDQIGDDLRQLKDAVGQHERLSIRVDHRLPTFSRYLINVSWRPIKPSPEWRRRKSGSGSADPSAVQT